MGRRNYSVVVPKNAEKLMDLAQSILQKHYQDGIASKLPPKLMEPLQQQLELARTHHQRAAELNRQKEKLNKERDLLLGLREKQGAYTESTVLYIIASVRDILLGQYRGNERELGDWGFEVNSPKGLAQVIVPRNADKLITLAKNVMRKHYNDGEASPLKAIDWNMLSTKLYEAEMKLQEARRVNREKEKEIQARNRALGIDRGQDSKTINTVLYIVKSVRDLLLGHFRSREQELGDWGFEVNFNSVGEDNPDQPTE
ncbi:MAG: hypothetical protein ACK4TA_21930 [Saprospiraceae bacterium]